MSFPKQDHGWAFGIDLWMSIAAFVLALLMIVVATNCTSRRTPCCTPSPADSFRLEPFSSTIHNAVFWLFRTAFSVLEVARCVRTECTKGLTMAGIFSEGQPQGRVSRCSAIYR